MSEQSIFIRAFFEAAVAGLVFITTSALAGDKNVKLQSDLTSDSPLLKVQCEHVLETKPAPLKMEGNLHFEAYSVLMSMDFTHGEIQAQLAPGLTPRSLSEFFKMEPAKVRSSKMYLRTSFEGDAIDQSSPEIIIYVPARGEHSPEQILSLIGGSNDPLYYWKNLSEEISTEYVVGNSLLNSNFRRMPLKAEVGFITPSETQDVVRRYVSIRGTVNFGYMTLGFDVHCDKVAEFTSRPRAVLKVATPDGILCRIPVLRSALLQMKHLDDSK